MAHKIAVAFETINRERRDALLEALLDVIGEHAEPGDSTKITLALEVKTRRGKRKIKDEIELVPGEPLPDLSDFGIEPETPMERAIRLASAPVR